jgi:hypothetical protein
MKNKKIFWWIVAILLAGAGAGAYFLMRRKPNEPEAPPPPIATREFSQGANDALNVDAYFGNNTTGTSQPATPKPRISLYDPVALSNIERVSEEIEKNPTLNGRVRTMNAIGSKLFDGMSSAAQEVIKRSFINVMDGKFNGNSVLAYPVEGKYINPEMRADIAKILAQFPNGVKLSPASIKIQSTNVLATFGYMASLRYNIVTGTRIPLTLTRTSESQPLKIKAEEIAYHISANQLRSADEIGLNTIKFAQNWLREIDRFNAAVREAAITKLENEGWVFDERTPA